MTAPMDVLPDANELMRQVLAALPARIRRRVRPSIPLGVAVFRGVVEHGWTPEQLALQASAGLREVHRLSVQQIVESRLQRATVAPAPPSVVAAARRRTRRMSSPNRGNLS